MSLVYIKGVRWVRGFFLGFYRFCSFDLGLESSGVNGFVCVGYGRYCLVSRV